MATDIDITFEPVAQALQKLQVRFYVCGSVASSAHGEMRATADIDVVAELQKEQVAPLIQLLGETFYADEVSMKEAIARRSSFNLIHQGTFIKVDIFAPKDREYDQQVLERCAVAKLGVDEDSIEAPISQPEDIILAKLEWFRLGGETSERQWHDILGVIKLQYFDLDFEYLQKWAPEIGVADLLERALDESGLSENNK
jgi:hypothetical protein